MPQNIGMVFSGNSSKSKSISSTSYGMKFYSLCNMSSSRGTSMFTINNTAKGCRTCGK